jgi:hypothetical protein
MVDLRRSCLVVNGIFAVAKDENTDRVVVDDRPFNALCAKPGDPSLAGPSLVAGLRVPPGRPRGEAIRSGKTDLSAFYHRFRIPDWMVPYQGLPQLSVQSLLAAGADPGRVGGFAVDDLVFPCLLSMPMGWSHAVFVAQRSHEFLMERVVAALPGRRLRAIRVGDSMMLCLGELRYAIYIDDVLWFALDWDPGVADQMREVMLTYMAVMDAAGFPVKPAKTVWPTTKAMPGLGLTFDGRRRSYGLHPRRLLALAAATRDWCALGTASSASLERLMGHWSWAVLVRRPLLSIFSAVYRFVEVGRGGGRLKVWPSVRRELLMAADLAPLMIAQLDRSWWPRVLCSDASSLAQGVTSSPWVPPDRVDDAEGDAVAFLSSQDPSAHEVWVSSRFHHRKADRKLQTHINALELYALLSAVRSASRRGCAGSRLLVLSDSMVVTAAVSKGRSSSFSLLRLLRRLAATLLALDTSLVVRWIPTSVNPADAPSRYPP